MINKLNGLVLLIIRLPILIFLILFGLITIIFFPKTIKSFKSIHFRIMMIWMNLLAKLLGIKTIIKGKIDNTVNLYVSNHVTYLDIIIINRLLPVNFIAKDEISNWPIIGSLASKTGTLFIKRGNNIESEKMINEMQTRFSINNKIIFFPEGKIGNGKVIKKFHSKLFKSIENKNISLQPFAIRYPEDFPVNTNYSQEISAKSEKGLMLSLYLDFLMKPKSYVILHFIEKVVAQDYDSESLSNLVAERINKKLNELDS
tara:strand:+ start:3157 stop:3930 length:774 start_codon:yes stop_codon:yes gene_type:complete